MTRTLVWVMAAVLVGWPSERTVAEEEGFFEKYVRKQEETEKKAAEYMAKATDDELRAELEKAPVGGEPERLLAEIARRGGPDWEKVLAKRHDDFLKRRENPEKSGDDKFVRWGRSNLHLLTALRRVQKKSDPLRILVAGTRKNTYRLTDSPHFMLLVVNLDEEKQTVYGFKNGGDDRSGRLARWRFEVKSEQGRVRNVPPPLGMGGGIYTQGKLEYGESWERECDLGQYVVLAAPGTYKMRVHYHNQDAIDNRADLSQLITSQSAEQELEIRPIGVYAKDDERRNARKWIAALPEVGPVKMLLGNYLQSPKSAAGELRNMHTNAIPDLIDAALDPDLKPGKRAWVLGLLFSITGQNDPREEGIFGSELLGRYEYEGPNSSGSAGMDKIDPVKQKAFAERWREWKTNGYFIIEK